MKVEGLRASSAKVGGIVFFGRILDKIRLNAAGRLPLGYNLGTREFTFYDARCTRFLHVRYDALVKRVLEGGTDDDILAWCFREGRKPTDEEIEVWNGFMAKRGWRDGSSRALEAAKADCGFAGREDIQTWFDLHDADEGRI